jgi:hypothetical protein
VDSIDLGDTEATDELLAGTEFDRFIQADELDRWNLQRNDPWCVVGEHKQWTLGELDVPAAAASPFPLFGDVETVRLPGEAIYFALSLSPRSRWRESKALRYKERKYMKNCYLI